MPRGFLVVNRIREERHSFSYLPETYLCSWCKISSRNYRAGPSSRIREIPAVSSHRYRARFIYLATSWRLSSSPYRRKSTSCRMYCRRITKFARNCRTVNWTATSSRTRTVARCAPVRHRRVIIHRPTTPLRMQLMTRRSVPRSNAIFTVNVVSSWTRTTVPFANASRPLLVARRLSDAGKDAASVTKRINAAVL